MQKQHVRLGVVSSALALACAGLQFKAEAAVPEIPASAAVATSKEDTSKPGFIWNFIEVDTSQPGISFANSTQDTEDALALKKGGNIADPNATGVASGAGTWLGTAPNALIQFIIPGVVNVDKSAGSNGNFTPDDQMPGVPGTSGSTDNISAEILYWVEIPSAGVYTFGVNSDDGFRTKVGGTAPQDKFATVVGEFNGGRGASDTIFKAQFDAPGLYAFRTTYENQGGGANLEMFSVKADGTKVLLNDTANGGLKVFRDITGGSPVYARTVSPGPGDIASFSSPVTVELVDGATATVDAATVKLSIDGTDTGATAKKTGNVTAITFTPSSFFASGSQHTAKLDYNAGGTAVSKQWTFSTVRYATLTAADAVQADTSKPGFLWDYFQNEGEQSNDNDVTEKALAGLLTAADGTPLPNNADPAAQGVASGPGKKLGTAPNALVEFEIPTVINMSKTQGDSNGNFTPDDQEPGAPGTTGSTDGQKAQILTYLDLPKGVITMGVNSDDGFRASAGAIKDIFASQFLGEFDGGRGAADTIFQFVVQDAGVYAVRVTWENGGGGSNVEWFSVKPDGTKVLINDTANGGIKAYRAKQGSATPDNPYITAVTPAVDATGVSSTPTISATIADGGVNKLNASSVKVLVDNQAVSATANAASGVTTVSFTPTAEYPPSSTHTVALTFANSAGTSRTVTWNFTTTFITKDTLFIEAEDADFQHGKFVTDKKIGMDGPYDGGSYAGLGSQDDLDFDWHADSPNGQTYRPDTNIAAGKEKGTAGNDRGYFTVKDWWTLGWNDPGEWYNYTRNFPSPAKDYEVFGHLASGGTPINIELDQITAGQGQTDTNQVKKLLGVFAPGRATAGWDSLEVFPLTDTNGAPLTVNLGGNVTLRATMLPGSNEDMDYFAFRPKSSGGNTGGGNSAGTNVISKVVVSSDHKSLTLTFTGSLDSADNVNGPYTPMSNAASPATIAITGPRKFYRVH